MIGDDALGTLPCQFGIENAEALAVAVGIAETVVPDPRPAAAQAGLVLEEAVEKVVQSCIRRFDTNAGDVVKLPWDSRLSLHYGESENFRPELGRFDNLGNPLPNPGGDTKEYGFMLSVMDDKFNVRVNWYETNLTNASASIGPVGNAIQAWARRNGVLWSDAARWRDNSNEFRAAASEVGFAAAEAWYNSTPAEVVDFWNIRKVFNSGGDVTEVQWDVPAGVSDTQDISSEGWKIELVYNPTKSWRIALNVAKQFATRTNLRPSAQLMVEK